MLAIFRSWADIDDECEGLRTKLKILRHLSTKKNVAIQTNIREFGGKLSQTLGEAEGVHAEVRPAGGEVGGLSHDPPWGTDGGDEGRGSVDQWW